MAIDKRNTYLQNNFKKLKKDHKYTNERLSELTGLSVDTFKKLGRKDAPLPSSDTLKRIAEAFHITPETLLSADFDQMLADERLALSLQVENLKQEAINNADTQTQFRAALIDAVYDEVLYFIDFLQFIGYEISFVPTKVYKSSKQIDEYKKKYNEELRAYERHSRILITEIENLKNQLAYTSCEDESYGNIQETIDLREYELQNLQNTINELKIVIDTSQYKQQLGMEQVIELIQATGKITNNRSRDRALNEIPLDVQIVDTAKDYTSHTMSFFDFYTTCEKYIADIRQKL